MYRSISSGCCGGQTNSTAVISGVVLRLPRERAALPTVALKTPPAGVSASNAVDAEFILTTQPLDVAGYGRTHLPDGRLPSVVRYNVYLLGSEVVTIDLCMPNAP